MTVGKELDLPHLSQWKKLSLPPVLKQEKVKKVRFEGDGATRESTASSVG